MSKFDELKKLAEAVPGLQWVVTDHTVYALEHDSWRKGVEQMRNRFSFSVQRGPETPESELKAIAEFCAAANPAAILELLAIQAQLVKALKLALPDIEEEEDKQRVANNKGSRHVTKARIIRAALAAAGAQS